MRTEKAITHRSGLLRRAEEFPDFPEVDSSLYDAERKTEPSSKTDSSKLRHFGFCSGADSQGLSSLPVQAAHFASYGLRDHFRDVECVLETLLAK